MAYNEVGRNATNKYRSKFDLIQIRVEPGEKQKISDYAAEHGESMNALINRAIKELMEKGEAETQEVL